MRRFKILNGPNHDLEGVIFTDGSCVVNTPSVNVSYDSFEEMDEKVVWIDEDKNNVVEPDPLFYAKCPKCSTMFQNDKPIDNVFCSVCKELAHMVLGVLNSGPVPGIKNYPTELPTVLPDEENYEY